jgi:hypothetical protein
MRIPALTEQRPPLEDFPLSPHADPGADRAAPSIGGFCSVKTMLDFYVHILNQHLISENR